MKEIADRDAIDALIQRDDLIERIMAVAIGFALIFGDVRIGAQALKDPPAAADRLKPVQDFYGLLTLHAGDDRADRRRCGSLALFHLLAREQVASSARLKQFPIVGGHR